MQNENIGLVRKNYKKVVSGLVPILRLHKLRIECEKFRLLHHFTVIASGMTGSRKTVWVQNLLEYARQVIHPPPQCIVWSYSQWQPAYDEMLHTMPEIEFVKGIPPDLDEDLYFNPKINNLMVIDDQMTETSNDKRILNLFTKGSHHRNLSVIVLLQNLYFQGKIMRTLSLNAAYLILFKNPRDKLQIMTLGKQMYPGKTEQFIHKYEAAVQRPYGYLFVDLKPNAPEECRLRTNVLPDDNPISTQQHGGQSDAITSMANYFERQSFMQPPLLKTLQRLKEQMEHILMDPNVPEELKVKEHERLLNQYLTLQQQLPNAVAHRPRQETIPPLLTAQNSPMPSLTTPENIPSTGLTSDSGIASKIRTPSLLERFTSKIKTPILKKVSTPTLGEVPSTPLKAPSSFGQPSAITLFSTSSPQSILTSPQFPPTPPPSKEKPKKWIDFSESGTFDFTLPIPLDFIRNMYIFFRMETG